eukprot:Sspe_Gene.2323::Locus_767_Transcript_1_1_Confidence_1.000_Length_3836::g.2323::m.2323
MDLLVVLLGLEVGEHSGAPDGVGHNLVPPVDQSLVPQLPEDPPHGLHVLKVHRFVVVLEVDPPTKAGDDDLPRIGVFHDDASAPLIVLRDPDTCHVVAGLDPVLLLDLEFDGKPVAVPTEATLNVVTRLMRVPTNNILDGPGEHVAVVGKPGSERRPVVEGEPLPPLRFLQRSAEGVDLLPVLCDGLLILREGRREHGLQAVGVLQLLLDPCHVRRCVGLLDGLLWLRLCRLPRDDGRRACHGLLRPLLPLGTGEGGHVLAPPRKVLVLTAHEGVEFLHILHSWNLPGKERPLLQLLLQLIRFFPKPSGVGAPRLRHLRPQEISWATKGGQAKRCPHKTYPPPHPSLSLVCAVRGMPCSLARGLLLLPPPPPPP